MSAQPKPLPVVVVDTREQTPLPFRNLPTIAGTPARRFSAPGKASSRRHRLRNLIPK